MPNQDRASSHSRASPSCWATPRPSTAAGRSTNSRFLEVSGLRVRYIGPGTEDKDAASVRADNCCPFGCGLYYYEVEILNKGRNGFVGVGFSAADVSLDRLPGWESHSYGYHGDDGHAFHHSGKGTPFGPTFGTGDIIGIIFNRAERTIAFTKNGMHLGVAFTNVCEERLYPTVGMRTPDEEILANFGGTPFRGDLGAIMADASRRIEQEIAQGIIPSGRQGPRVPEQLVFEYLRHQGYWSTAARVGADLLCDVDSVSAVDMKDIQARKSIGEAIVTGDINLALDLIHQAAPNMLTKHHALNFRLQCQKFMELVRLRNVDMAIEFGQTVLGPAVRTAQDQELLQDALTLLAHDNPVDCPSYQQLLGEDAHAQLAASVNAAILRAHGRSERSCLETVIRQLEVVKTELLCRGDPASALIDFDV